MLRRIALLLACVPSAAMAQGTWRNDAPNDSSLAGIKKVALIVLDVDTRLGPASVQQLQSAAQLELRKAGIRVATPDEGAAAMNDVDAIVQIGFFGRQRALTNDQELGMRVLQRATIARTQKTGWYETWLYEKRTETNDPKRSAGRLLTDAVNEFLTKWLDMNGR